MTSRSPFAQRVIEPNVTKPMRDFARHPGVELLGSPTGYVGADAHAAGEPGGEPGGEPAAGESRRHYRSAHKLRWPVELVPVRADRELEARGSGRIQGRSQGRIHDRIRAETLGVSLGGTFVVCEEPFAVDTDLHLWLYPHDPLPRGPRVLRLLGRIRWINATPGELPRGFGVAFRALTAADEIALHGSFSRSSKVL